MGEGIGSGLQSSSSPDCSVKEGGQQGGAGYPGVLQGQGEAGGVSRRVSVVGELWGVWWPARGVGVLALHAVPPPGTSLWSCRLSSCTPSPTTTSPSPGSRQVSTTLPHPQPEEHPPQLGEHSWSFQHPPTPSLSSPQLLLTQTPLWTPTSLNLIPSKRPPHTL